MTQSTISPVARTLGIDVTVTAVIDETPEARTIVLNFPDGTDYRPGQFITVRIPSDRTGLVARSYSLSTAPNVDASPAITVKRTRDGYGSNWLCDNAEPGLVLHILPPSGVFTPRSWEGPLYLFAAGSGVTPVMSILRSALAEHDTDVVLFYANRDHESTIFASAIDELTARHPAQLTVNHWLETERGLPTADAVSGVLTDAVGTGEAFICGPAPFMDLVEHTLREHGIHHDQVHVERYVSLTGDPFTLDTADHEGSGASEITVTIDGDVRTVRCGTDTVLLDALLASDVDAPYSCREGDCGSCVARLTAGEVDHGNGIALEPEDIDDGYLLTCQATPKSGRVGIEFD
ncbi:ferredoxin--NADP reductase [Gordonia amicalis]|uniref:Ferredoxin--NADP reductase n=1 Tax=Gordonia amicalis TaxID=89053 RepID=A0AAE4R1A6_9ACTN|nr:ferredoxin--NADP reductase [Gordonia amicalis]MCZ4578555.1 ferredoxin--NADP reductase [Gordonia amicalis]MCZ4651643.1 ferredoxin--NADP reductase [Gordonia amicalis]MDJ0455101.1 ferredoxin--NADP reductase [Gordonia amicalis]MDV6307750.1 ferredoxin--NADP reductase [Gordonia amicalis]MDV6311394.1 ferredoxin--NADP reductase [Gordonia amicalis]